MSTTFRAVRDGKTIQLVQKTTSTGRPLCIVCTKEVPAAYMRYHPTLKGLFCTDTCGAAWAGYAGTTVFMREMPGGEYVIPEALVVEKRERKPEKLCECGHSRAVHKQLSDPADPYSGYGPPKLCNICECKQFKTVG